MKTKISLAVILVFGASIGWHFKLLRYGMEQGIGQAKIIFNTKPVEQVLKDEALPDSIKNKIRLIGEIRQFAFDSLGINRNKNYSTFYNQKGKPILWVVTASPPFEMKAYEWSFPVLGKVSYKGFFDNEKARKEASEFKKLGYDTDIGEVSAWSTLGWLKDPILSSMLKRKPGSLANLIIHELTHGTLYVKGNVEFNENLASFVGDFGARKFMIQKYGLGSKEFLEYEEGLNINAEYSELVLHWSLSLDSLYKTFGQEYSLEEKNQKKADCIALAKESMVRYLKGKNKYKPTIEKQFLNLNNTYFMDYITYRAKQNEFELEFNTKFHKDFPLYMRYLKEKYPSL